jgi:hypothetical protein
MLSGCTEHRMITNSMTELWGAGKPHALRQ